MENLAPSPQSPPSRGGEVFREDKNLDIQIV